MKLFSFPYKVLGNYYNTYNAALRASKRKAIIVALSSRGVDVEMRCTLRALSPEGKRLVINLLGNHSGSYLRGKGPVITFTFPTHKEVNSFIHAVEAIPSLKEFGLRFRYS